MEIENKIDEINQNYKKKESTIENITKNQKEVYTQKQAYLAEKLEALQKEMEDEPIFKQKQKETLLRCQK